VAWGDSRVGQGGRNKKRLVLWCLPPHFCEAHRYLVWQWQKGVSDGGGVTDGFSEQNEGGRRGTTAG
jgi:hypothetical protein